MCSSRLGEFEFVNVRNFYLHKILLEILGGQVSGVTNIDTKLLLKINKEENDIDSKLVLAMAAIENSDDS